MNRSIRQLCLSVLFAATAARAVPAAESADAKAHLADLRARMAALSARLGGDLETRDALLARVRAADLSITAARRRLDALRGAEAAAQRQRADLSAEQLRVQRSLDAERAALAAQARAAYLMGRQEQLKLLLSQSDPAAAGRMSAYYEYFVRARAARIDAIRDRMDRLHDLDTRLERAASALRALQSAARGEMDQVEHARAQRAVALAAVTRRISGGNEELERLRREEQAEEALVADVSPVVRDLPTDERRNFGELRGRLPWPVPGRIAVDPHRGGVLIEGARGAKVRAPYFGRVVYADWLQGLGLLLIIGHDGNYMTLYGHAEVLYKSVGDWVAPGDVIAALADSAGAAAPLYFEIREGRVPRNPKIWLAPAP